MRLVAGEELSKKQAAQEASMKKLRVQLREVEEEKQRLASRLQVSQPPLPSQPRLGPRVWCADSCIVPCAEGS